MKQQVGGSHSAYGEACRVVERPRAPTVATLFPVPATPIPTPAPQQK